LPGGTDAVGTLNMANSLTLNSTAMQFDLSINPATVGGGVNDLLAITGNLALTGTTTIKINPLGALDTTRPYTIITYTGNLIGGAANLAFSSDSRYTFTVDLSFPGQVRVWATGQAANLVWKGNDGTNPSFWDLTTTNWINSGSPDKFQAGDSVT